ncbi:MAG: hypothetical protein FWC39_13295 [Bacteroidetes bacterium]|nr:hypothetical protein [Bacteroidota bacterium]
MKKLKLLVTAVALLVLAVPTQAQLELGLIIPDKKTEFGFLFKPSPSFAITLRGSFTNRLHAYESRWRWGLTMGYASLKTTMDAFPIFKTRYTDGIISEQKEVYYLGEQRFKNNRLNLFFGGGMVECKILKTALSPIVGLELRMHDEWFTYTTYYFDTHTEPYTDSHNGVTMAFFPKAGVVYDMDWWTFQLTAGFNKDFAFGNSKGFPYSAISLTTIYYF